MLLRMAVVAIYVYIFIYMCHTFLTLRVHRRFYGLYLKKRIDHLGKFSMDILNSSMMKKTAADFMTEGKKTGWKHDLRD